MATEYIELEAAIRALQPTHAPAINEVLASVLRRVPAADVVEAGEAEWRYQTMSVPGGNGQTYAKWSCSACKGKQKKRSRYCPDCGKRMKNGGPDNG